MCYKFTCVIRYNKAICVSHWIFFHNVWPQALGLRQAVFLASFWILSSCLMRLWYTRVRWPKLCCHLANWNWRTVCSHRWAFSKCILLHRHIFTPCPTPTLHVCAALKMLVCQRRPARSMYTLPMTPLHESPWHRDTHATSRAHDMTCANVHSWRMCVAFGRVVHNLHTRQTLQLFCRAGAVSFICLFLTLMWHHCDLTFTGVL